MNWKHKLHEIYSKTKLVIESCETSVQLRLSIRWTAQVFRNHIFHKPSKKKDEFVDFLMEQLQPVIDEKLMEIEKPKEKPCQKVIKGYGTD